MSIHMASKNISVTEEVYKKLLIIKEENESFSELFLRLLGTQKQNVEKSFGAWKLTTEEKEQIWDKISNREGRKWRSSDRSEIK